MGNFFYILCSIIFFYSCNNAQEKQPEQSTNTKIENFEIDSTDFSILEYKSNWYWIFKNVQPANLSEKELIEIEVILKRGISENNLEQKRLLEEHNRNYPENKWTETGFELKLDGYKRQYVPVINEKGEKEVWVNFFCDDWGTHKWKTEILVVLDGGNCYFNLKINLMKKSYSELSINGYA